MEITGGETQTVTYTSGAPDQTTYRDEFQIEEDTNELILHLKMQYDTDGSTAPTSATTFPNQDRIIANLTELRFMVSGKEFFSIEGMNLRLLASLFYEDDEYFIEELDITTGTSNEVKYANIPLPLSIPASAGEIQYEVKLQTDDAYLSANDKYTIDSFAFSIIPQYGSFTERLKVSHFDKTISGTNDIQINKEEGKLHALITNGYNTTVNMSDLILKDKKVDVIRADYYEMQGKMRQWTHGVLDYATYPNVLAYKFDEMLDVDDTTINKLKTSTSQSCNFTQVFINEIAEGTTAPTHRAMREKVNTLPIEVAPEYRSKVAPRKIAPVQRNLQPVGGKFSVNPFRDGQINQNMKKKAINKFGFRI